MNIKGPFIIYALGWGGRFLYHIQKSHSPLFGDLKIGDPI